MIFLFLAGLSLTGTSIAQPAVPAFTLQDLLLSRAGELQPPIEQQILSFYLERNFSFVWTDPADIFAARSALAHAAEQGLHPADYAVRGDRGTPEFDLSLTSALFHYASDVRTGRFRQTAYKDAVLPSSAFDFSTALNRALARHRLVWLLDELPPVHPQYQRLVGALSFYRALAAQGGWPQVTNETWLGYRLMIEDPSLSGQLPSSAGGLQAALLRYQERNGLIPDGKLGPDTLRELNVPVTVRIGQIVANLERWRWIPADLERRRVEVNVPDQSLDLMDGEDIALHSRVIIGKKNTPTPILRTTALSVIANPAWDIPDDIAARQFLPHMRRDANFLARRNMTLVDAPPGTAVDWRKVSAARLPYQLRQPPGPDNALGRLMLDSPNRFDVYMHDTPSKPLFEKSTREFSNGCVRVEQIERLARLALDDDAALDESLQSGETRTLALARPLPVYLLYWTAIARADGSVGFRADRYNRDSSLLVKMEAGRSGQIKLGSLSSSRSVGSP